MTKEELIKNQFPNDEFLRSAVSQIVDKCTAELEKENKRLNEKLSEIVECFVSSSYTDDFEMMNAGREIYELFYPDKKSYRDRS